MTRREKTEDAPKFAETDAGAVPVLFRLVALIEEVSRLKLAERPSTEAPGEREEDDRYVYIWLELPGRAGPDIDINLHGNSLMVRVEKEPARYRELEK